MKKFNQLKKGPLQNIINIRASMNTGLSEVLKSAFPNTSPVARPLVNFLGIPHPNWIVGFVDGEGCFYVNIKKISSKLGAQVLIIFSLTQHSYPHPWWGLVMKCC